MELGYQRRKKESKINRVAIMTSSKSFLLSFYSFSDRKEKILEKERARGKEFCGFSTTVFHQFSHSTKQSICFPRCCSPKMEMKTRREKISRSPFVARQTSIDPAKPSSFSWVIAVVEHRKGVCFSPTDFHFLKDIFVCLTCTPSL